MVFASYLMNRHEKEIAFPLTPVVRLAHRKGIAANTKNQRCDFIHESDKSMLNTNYEQGIGK